MENSPWICFANQWTGFYMIRTSIIKELKKQTLIAYNEIVFSDLQEPHTTIVTKIVAKVEKDDCDGW